MEECNKHGGVHHIYVDKASTQGNVYVKCPTIPTAVAAVNALHGRWFAGKVFFNTLFGSSAVDDKRFFESNASSIQKSYFRLG